MRKLLLAEPAARDLGDIIEFVALDSPAAAQNVHRTLAAAADRLTRFPELGRPGRLPDTREFSVPSLPYIIAYQVDAQAVTVIAVFHGARDLVRALVDRRAELKRGEPGSGE